MCQAVIVATIRTTNGKVFRGALNDTRRLADLSEIHGAGEVP